VKFIVTTCVLNLLEQRVCSIYYTQSLEDMLQEQRNKPLTLFTKLQLNTIIRGNKTKYTY